MKFMNAQCVVCRHDVFDEQRLFAFRNTKPSELVDLEGQQPWCGIICICLDCVKTIEEIRC